jgi:endonuclease G
MVEPYLFNSDYSIGLIDFGFPRRTNPTTNERFWDTTSVALRFHVTRKLPLEELERLERKVLPRCIGPFQTDVIQAEYSIPLPVGMPQGIRASRRPRLCGGLAIAAFRDFYGTLGTVVRDRQTGELMLLSNWHVLYATRGTRPGQPIYQPALNGPRPQSVVVARVARETLSGNGAGRIPLDAAVATLVDQGPDGWENYQLEFGRLSGVAPARLGMEVIKSGVTTGRSKGVVTGIEGFSKMTYEGNWPRLIERVVTVSRYPLDAYIGLVSQAGDSGSIWVEEASGQAVALHYAGLRDGTRGQGMDLGHVMEAIGVELATSA